MTEHRGSALFLAAGMTILALLVPPRTYAESLVASDAHTRLVLAFKVAGAPLQKWLPSGWELNPPTTGPARGANLFLNFVDRLINLDPEGKLIAGGRDRYLGFIVPVKDAVTGKVGNMVIRLYTGNEKILPGAYGTSVLADVHREETENGTNVEAGVATDSWEVRSTDGGAVKVRLRYGRGPLTRSAGEQKIFSPLRPDFFRIYRADQAADVVKSVPANVDRAETFHFEITVNEFLDVFDGTHELISISAMPWVARRIYLP